MDVPDLGAMDVKVYPQRRISLDANVKLREMWVTSVKVVEIPV